jgi:hypothetical protein
MAKKHSIQYTLRGVPERADLVLRETAARERKSLNEVAVEALARGAGVSGEPVRYDDLDDLAGKGVKSPAFDRMLKEMDTIDKDLWK